MRRGDNGPGVNTTRRNRHRPELRVSTANHRRDAGADIPDDIRADPQARGLRIHGGASFNPLAIQPVTNISTDEAINVIVTMTALSAAGTVLDKEQGYADVVRSGQTVGVVVNFVEDPSGVTAVKTVRATATWVPDANPSAVLTATGATLTPDGQGGAYVAGTVSSNYATALANVSVAAVCYSATGAVVGIAEDSVTSVPARGSAPFRAVGNLNAAVPAHCAAWAYPGAGP